MREYPATAGETEVDSTGGTMHPVQFPRSCIDPVVR